MTCCLQYLCFTFFIKCVTSSSYNNDVSYHDDEITSLPGLEESINFKQYSGYLPVSSTGNMFYWFVESQSDPTTDPVLLWLSGGPCCSSVYGLFHINGPFQYEGQNLKTNPYSWNKIANVLYLESPLGVGFSYNSSGYYNTDDILTAHNNRAAVLAFFERFPHFKNNDFYATGESYGAIFISMLMESLKDDKSINLVGSAIGNGMWKRQLALNTQLEYLYYHGIISVDRWFEMTSTCCNGERFCTFVPFRSEECQSIVARTWLEVQRTPLSVFNIYSSCGGLLRSRRDDVIDSVIFVLSQSMKHFDDPAILLDYEEAILGIRELLPCEDPMTGVTYMNRADVRESLHVRENTGLPPWTQCSSIVNQYDGSYQKIVNDVFEEVVSFLQDKSHRMLIYNGDLDSMANILHTEAFAESLAKKDLSLYKQWYYEDEQGYTQIAGSIKHYEQLIYLTVKGAGHVVPYDRPDLAFVMIERFLNKTL